MRNSKCFKAVVSIVRRVNNIEQAYVEAEQWRVTYCAEGEHPFTAGEARKTVDNVWGNETQK